jgi:hypothetical protein
MSSAGALVTATGAQAAPLSRLQLIQPELSLSPLLPAKTKCIVIGGHEFCKDFDHNDKDKTTPPTDTKAAAKCPENQIKVKDRCTCPPGQVVFSDDVCREPAPSCPMGTDPKTGKCICPPGQVDFNDGTCGRPCGYGMSGKPPKCRCVTGATLQVTGPTTKACLCPDGKPPEEVDGNYACQNLGPQ